MPTEFDEIFPPALIEMQFSCDSQGLGGKYFCLFRERNRRNSRVLQCGEGFWRTRMKRKVLTVQAKYDIVVFWH